MSSKKSTKKKAPSTERKLPEFIDRLELKHSFSDAEKASILTDLSRKHEERESLVDQAKSSAKQWKSKIEEVQLKINDLSMKGRDGFEMQSTEVRVVLDKKKKKKKLYRVDNGDFIEERDMTDFDFERLPMTIVPTIKPGDGLTSVGEALETAENPPEPKDEGEVSENG